MLVKYLRRRNGKPHITHSPVREGWYCQGALSNRAFFGHSPAWAAYTRATTRNPYVRT